MQTWKFVKIIVICLSMVLLVVFGFGLDFVKVPFMTYASATQSDGGTEWRVGESISVSVTKTFWNWLGLDKWLVFGCLWAGLMVATITVRHKANAEAEVMWNE